MPMRVPRPHSCLPARGKRGNYLLGSFSASSAGPTTGSCLAPRERNAVLGPAFTQHQRPCLCGGCLLLAAKAGVQTPQTALTLTLLPAQPSLVSLELPPPHISPTLILYISSVDHRPQVSPTLTLDTSPDQPVSFFFC